MSQREKRGRGVECVCEREKVCAYMLLEREDVFERKIVYVRKMKFEKKRQRERWEGRNKR